MPLRVLIADDHCIVRQGLRALLERAGFEVTAEAANGQEAVALEEAHNPDAIVLDLMMPTLNGLDAARQILLRRPSAAILLLTMRMDEEHVAAALAARIRGYVLKTQASEDLVRGIHEIVRGHVFLGGGVSRPVIDGYIAGTRTSLDTLTPRERQILQLVSEGHTSKEIAALLELSVKTVESYRARVMEKLDLHETAALVRYAIRHGVIEA